MANITSKQLHDVCNIGQENELTYTQATFSDNMGQDVKGYAVSMRGFYDANELRSILADLDAANKVRAQYEASQVVAIERPNNGYLTMQQLTEFVVNSAGGNEVSARVDGVVFCVRAVRSTDVTKARFFIRKGNDDAVCVYCARFSQVQAFILDHTQQ